MGEGSAPRIASLCSGLAEPPGNRAHGALECGDLSPLFSLGRLVGQAALRGAARASSSARHSLRNRPNHQIRRRQVACRKRRRVAALQRLRRKSDRPTVQTRQTASASRTSRRRFLRQPEHRVPRLSSDFRYWSVLVFLGAPRISSNFRRCCQRLCDFARLSLGGCSPHLTSSLAAGVL